MIRRAEASSLSKFESGHLGPCRGVGGVRALGNRDIGVNDAHADPHALVGSR